MLIFGVLKMIQFLLVLLINLIDIFLLANTCNIISLNQGVRIRSIIDPVEELDLVNKKYVDSKVLSKNLVGYITYTLITTLRLGQR